MAEIQYNRLEQRRNIFNTRFSPYRIRKSDGIPNDNQSEKFLRIAQQLCHIFWWRYFVYGILWADCQAFH